MRIINIYEAKTHLSKLINEALQGEEIVIAKSGHPLIRLIPFEESDAPKRKGGQLSGMMMVSDDFDDPLPESIMKQFYSDDDL